MLRQNLVLQNRLQEGIDALVVNNDPRVSARKLTTNKESEIGKDVRRPTLRWNHRIPQMSRIPALQEDKECSQDVDNVHCNNHEP